MFEIKKHKRVIESNIKAESEKIEYKDKSDRFLNISPKNYIKSMENISTKKAIIPMILISIMDRDNMIYHTLDELSNIFDYPKTGLSVLFSEYKKNDFIKKKRNGLYMINPLISYKGSKYERDKLLDEYIKIR